MKRGITLGLILLTGALSTTACGDDDDDGGGGNGNGQNVECEPGGGGVCQNETDCVVVESGEARATAQTCGLGCMNETDPGACAVMCITDEIEISQQCAGCYAALVGCAVMNCAGPCADPTADECTQCQIDTGCRDTFDSCSGLTTAT